MNTPDIVKELREAERLGKMTSLSFNSHNVSDNLTPLSVDIPDKKEFDVEETSPLTHTTDYKTIEEELKIKDSAIASSINAIAIADLNGNLTYVNHSFLEM